MEQERTLELIIASVEQLKRETEAADQQLEARLITTVGTLEHEIHGANIKWSDLDQQEQWKAAWGVWWRTLVASVALYVVILLVIGAATQ